MSTAAFPMTGPTTTSRRPSGAILAALVALLVLPALPAEAATPQDVWVQATDAVVARAPASLLDEPDFRNASAHHAYRTAMLDASVAHATALAHALWEEAQNAPNPAQQYLYELANETQANAGRIDHASARMAALEAGDLHANQLEILLTAANVLADAEQEHVHAVGYLMPEQSVDVFRSETGRYSFAHPVAMAGDLAAATERILDLVPAPSGPRADLAGMAQRINGLSLPTFQWPVAHPGIVEETARRIYAYSALQGNTTVAELDAVIQQLPAERQRLQDAGYDGVHIVEVQGDASWWLTQARADPDSAVTAGVVRSQAAYAHGAILEANLLAAPANRPSSAAMWIGLACAGVALVGGLWWRGRRRSGGRKGKALLGLLALLMVLPPVQGALGMAAVNDPSAPPTVVPGPEGGAWGSAAALANGTLLFAWPSCPGTFVDGCSDLYLRMYDPVADKWSASWRAVDDLYHVSIAKVFLVGADVHVVWEEQLGNATAPVVLVHCVLSGRTCGARETFTDTAGTAIMFSGAVGGNGHLRIAYLRSDLMQVHVREWSSAGWGADKRFDTGSSLQTRPNVLCGTDGACYVTWEEGVPGSKETKDRRVELAIVDAGADVARKVITVPAQGSFQQMAAAFPIPEGVGALYGTQRDLFFAVLDPATGQWSAATNVSRGHPPTAPALVGAYTLGGGDVLAVWQTGTVNTFQMWAARRSGGFWLAPELLVGKPYQEHMFVPMAQPQASGDLVLAWTGNGPGIADNILLTRRIAGGTAPPPGPPTVTWREPRAGGWTGSAVDLAAQLEFAATPDAASVVLTVDGRALATTLSPDGHAHARATGLAEGAHHVTLHAADRLGAACDEQWDFAVDATAPALSVQIVGPATSASAPWANQVLTVVASAPQDGGSPVHLQVDHDAAGDWRDATAAGWKAVGLVPSIIGAAVPENRLLDVRLRAVDDAGNVALGSPMALGWDATPPLMQGGPAPTTRPGRVPLLLTDQAAAGSPLHYELQVSGPGGNAQQTSMDGMVILPAEGTWQVRGRASDAAGNAQSIGPWTVVVDGTPPTVSVAWQGDDFRLTASDAGGLAHVAMTAGDGRPIESNATGTSAASDGRWEGAPIGVNVRDAAGNELSGFIAESGGQLVASAPEKPAGKSTPALPLALVGLAVLGLALGRRRQDG
ncbi:MAG: hypothetical protein V4510_01810 [bacterium]